MEQPTPFDIDPIAIKYIRDEPLTPQEETLLGQWIARGEGRLELLQKLRDDPEWTKANVQRIDEHSPTRIWEKLESRLHADGAWEELEPIREGDAAGSRDMQEEDAATHVIPEALRTPLWRYAVAASILILAAGAYFYGNHHNNDSTPTAAPAVAAKELLPAGPHATLTLSDGSHIDLDTTANGVLTNQGNTFIAKQDNLLAYNKASSEKPAGLTYNTLATPRGGQFELTLSDGTRVWLDNASSLRYPTWFTGKTREVELTGEAYFEVAKDATHPFRVHILNSVAGEDGGDVDVLGTSFNIMAYSDEGAETATLVQGSIRYSHAGSSALLKPDEQSIVDAQGRLKTLHHVDVAEITSWTRGYFHFENSDLHETMRQLARWYDITVRYEGNVPPQAFNGGIQRNIPLSVVLKELETDNLHFQLDDKTKTLTVTP